MSDGDSGKFPLSHSELIDRIVEVSVMLHLEQGDRQQLQNERAQLMEHARRSGIIGASQEKD